MMQHMRRARSFHDRFGLLDHAISCAPTGGAFAEFGVFQGASINHIAARTERTIYGFDSFEGLPEDWIFDYTKERFRLKAPPKVRRNVELIKGWYDQSLPRFFAEHDQTLALVHIDCDLYSSTKTVFENIAPRLATEAVIVFDEFFNYPGWKEDGEYKAFVEFAESNDMEFHYIGYTTNSASVAVKLGAEPPDAEPGTGA